MPGDDDASSRDSGAQAAAAAAALAAGIDSHADTAVATGETIASDSSVGPDEGGALHDTVAGDSVEAEALRESTDDLLGTTLQERYQITRKIGQGGMGAVYEATHLALGKRVAVKVLLDKYANRDRIVARLEQEARLASSIGHDNIVDITDFGETATGRTFVVMEYLEGESLGQCLTRDGPLEPHRAIRIARQAASALGAAHNKGIIHRDVKPENVFLRHRGDKDFVKVVDFGISKTVRPDDEGESSPRLTQTGMVLGTPLYMSPEQARGDEDPDKRIDVYSLGVIMYEMVTGEVPFRGNNYLNIVSQVISVEPTAPSELNPEVTDDFETVILKAMEKEPEDRYKSMEELDADLAVLEGAASLGSTSARITAARRRRGKKGGLGRALLWVGGASVVASLVVIAVMLATGREGEEPTATVNPVAAPPLDAGVVESADAAPAIPAFELATIRVISTPAGATVFRADRQEGVTPVSIQLVKENKKVELILELDGYDDSRATIQPLEDDGRVVKVRMKRAKKSGAKKLRGNGGAGVVPAGDGPGRGRDRGHDDGGGDLTPPSFEKN